MFNAALVCWEPQLFKQKGGNAERRAYPLKRLGHGFPDVTIVNEWVHNDCILNRLKLGDSLTIN
jgi:hypothetical protein